MKKISRLFFYLASAALISLSFFACSEPATDDNSFDPFDSIPENPPAAVGEDPFKGKTITSDENKFIFNTDGTCKDQHEDKYKYSYNTEKKELYLLPQSYRLTDEKTLTSFQEYADIMKKEYLNMSPNISQELIDVMIQTNGLSHFGLRTYSYEISGSSVTLTLKPEVGLSTFSNNADGIGLGLIYFNLQFSVPSDGFYSGKATINKAEKKISCNKFWFSSDNGQNIKEKACKFVASYTEDKNNGTITLKVLEKPDFLSFVSDTVVLKSSSPWDGTYTIE